MKKTTVDLNKNTGHKIWSAVALAGLFVCGIMIGVVSHKDAPSKMTNKMIFSPEQCQTLSEQISYYVNYSNYAELEKAQAIFAESCAGFVPAAKVEEKPVVKEEESDKPLSACARIERILLGRINSEAYDAESLAWNAVAYTQLRDRGCPENTEKWTVALNDTITVGKGIDEKAFVASMNDYSNNSPVKTESTCQEIERLLKYQIRDNAGGDIEFHLQNADIYSSLSSRGCAENSDMYKSLALRELEIVSALSDDELSQTDTEIVIDTYKKMNMQKQAKEFLNKIQKLTDPAIDFIMEMEKIINE